MNLSHIDVSHIGLWPGPQAIEHRARLGPNRTCVKRGVRPTLKALSLSALVPSFPLHALPGKPPRLLSHKTAVSLSLSEHAAFQQNLKRNWKVGG